MANAAIIVTPKELTKPCTNNIPKFIIDCCSDVSTEYLATLPNTDFSNVNRKLRNLIFLIAYMVRGIPENTCAAKVEIAGPFTPKGHTRTNKKSNIILIVEEIIKK